MTLIFTFNKDWILTHGINFLKGDDLTDVMAWVQAHCDDECRVIFKRIPDGYRMEAIVDI